MTRRKNTSQGGEEATRRNANAGLEQEKARFGTHPGDAKQMEQSGGDSGQMNEPAGPSDTGGAFKGEQLGAGVKDPDTGRG